MNGHIWASIDPIKKKVDIYPKWVSLRIEEKYKKLQSNITSHYTINLGSQFYNATIHLKHNNYYQTTLGFNGGHRGNNKQPGYRKILPINVINGNCTIYTKIINGQWTIVRNNSEETESFNITLDSSEDIIKNDENINTNVSFNIQPWESNDLLEDSNNDKYVTVWMWCRGIPEKQGNVFKLDDSWWAPYFCEDNKNIDNAFNQKQLNTKITLFDNTERVIEFDNFTCYAKQVKYPTTQNPSYTVRMVKKVTMKIYDLKQKINNLNTSDIDPTIITSLIESDNIPNEFYCSISQDIMTDPVKTIDNHTYDRISIERWFTHRVTSPLTGLPLSSTILTPNNELKKQIQDFAKLQIEKTKKNNPIATL